MSGQLPFPRRIDFVGEHRRAMRPALMSNFHQCSSCHTVNAHAGLNGIGFIRLHNENDDWSVSAFARGVGPDEEVVRCQDCHMGKQCGSSDPVAARTGGSHRSHRFLAANTFLASNFGDREQPRGTEGFLRGEGVPAEIRRLVPDRSAVELAIEAPAVVRAGAGFGLTVALSNRGVGHAFPAGPNEVNEAWVEVEARAGDGRVLLSSGALDDQGVRDPEAFALVSVPVDAEGREVFATAGLAAGFRLRRAILHGASDRHGYRVSVPADAAGARLRIAARLRYRKADADFARLLDGFTIDDVPITDLASQVREIDVAVRSVDGGS